MNDPALLTGPRLRTYQAIVQPTPASTLAWDAVHALLRALGQVRTEANGAFTVTRNGQTLTLPSARTPGLATPEEFLTLRLFLEHSEPTRPPAGGGPTPCLLVIDHREARLYHWLEPGAVAQHFLPPPPEAAFRQAHHARHFSRGKEKPDPASYFAPIAAALPAAGPILLLGPGTGMSSERDQWKAWLQAHHRAAAARVVSAAALDEHHMTEAQVLAQAREFFHVSAPS